MAKKEEMQGLTVKKEKDFSEWYSQIIQKAELAEHSSVSGCIVLRPNAFQVWEQIKQIFDKKIKKTGHKNAYFPMLIPEKLLEKEKEHIQGFSPEVAWVTQTGETKLNERLALRPTSESIMYESFSKWIRSHRDLPLLLNQWCNIVRWEFKHPKPFLRTREFLWQEGHTVHETKKEAWNETLNILKEYEDLMKNYLALPIISGMKTNAEKFAGADTTTAVETLMPDGKALQLGTSHFLGQNFSKAFEIKFLNEKSEEKFAWQTSWGISTRLIGAVIMMHGDDKGLVLPPKIAFNKIVIVPIIFEDSKTKIVKKAKELEKKLKKFNPLLDDREEYSAGWKFNEWELKGIPVRIEIGPKDMEKEAVMVVRRDTGEKKQVKIKELEKTLDRELEQMQKELYKKAHKFLDKNVAEAANSSDFQKAIKNGKMVHCFFCEDEKCEKKIKEETGATNRVIPFNQKESQGKCGYCESKAERKSFFAKSY